MPDENWETLKIPRGLSDEIDEFLETGEAKKRGYYNKREFISNAIRKALEEYHTQLFQHVNTYEDKIRLKDPKQKSFIDVYIKGPKLYCDTCEDFKCIHIAWCWYYEPITTDLKKHGLRSPF